MNLSKNTALLRNIWKAHFRILGTFGTFGRSASVVGGVIDNLIEISRFMGEVNVVWNQMDKNEMLKEAIMTSKEPEQPTKRMEQL